ncbi:hypothetical protein Cs7R123_06760 [Catellatospora sp. TT07R-123]|nr:hypothetical protein Cs7R123_06760 [Catellatospora sp. TT07R-123]
MAVQGDGLFTGIVEIALATEDPLALPLQYTTRHQFVDAPADGEGGVQRQPRSRPLRAPLALALDGIPDLGVMYIDEALRELLIVTDQLPMHRECVHRALPPRSAHDRAAEHAVRRPPQRGRFYYPFSTQNREHLRSQSTGQKAIHHPRGTVVTTLAIDS